MSEEHACRTCQHLLQNNICGSDEHKTMQLGDVCGAWEESMLARLITEHPERIPLKFQTAELLQKVQQLESRNAELEDLRRWRDAEKEPPEEIIWNTILARVDMSLIDISFPENNEWRFLDNEIQIALRYRPSSTGPCWTPCSVTNIRIKTESIIEWCPLDLQKTKEE